MKFYIAPFISLAFILFFSCKEEPKNPEIKDKKEEPKVETPVVKDTPEPDGKICYLYAVNKDSISLNMTMIDKHAKGSMNFNFYQVDGSWGTFEGLMNGDTLRGIYDFEAEGTKSKREVIFLKQGNSLIRGKGETELTGNTELFKKDVKFSFDGGHVLKQVDCPATKI